MFATTKSVNDSDEKEKFERRRGVLDDAFDWRRGVVDGDVCVELYADVRPERPPPPRSRFPPRYLCGVEFRLLHGDRVILLTR